ncbi:hypothetical protein N7462_006311 [Penicillium macrosclerotiorum]|uniref:uncharacterized protein n=1 Tax=Penicillium macrosclerotiorum TaxID=303699 RepID=UPI002546678D|nr:uncharacterized protein N7462_006311 [Penicillium macrosclerotiorum]KAJ5683146.1 hypothetical protein N7462_006311 [Penicillium macrosclerotiorum]
MDSPPKRRKTGATARVDAGQSVSLGRSPSRPSFESPTRSSLAKSHPDILERALSRSPVRQNRDQGSETDRRHDTDVGAADAKSRVVGLRGRKALRPSLNPSSPLKAPRVSDTAPILSPSRRASGVEAFSKRPRRFSKRISATDFFLGSPVRKKTQPPEDFSNTPEGQLALELGSATKDAVDNLDMDDNIGTGFVDDDALEPDLPPTPTQLGLEKAPERPRGLLSSSPSARHEKRAKRRAADVLHGSPLKSLKFQQSPEAVMDEGIDVDMDRDRVSEAALNRQKERKSLAAELRQLKDDVAELTKWTERVDSGANLTGDIKELNNLLSLLAEESSHLDQPMHRKPRAPISALLSTLLPFSSNIPRPPAQELPLPTNPYALKDDSQQPSYLSAFAPLALRTHTTRTSSFTNSLFETHTLVFTPPSPFPASLYNVSVVYETNPETQFVTSISVPADGDTKKRKVPNALRQWIDSRLANPLLRLDVATICWGINRYWEASVSRAQLWARIEHKYNQSTSKRGGAIPQSQDGTITLAEVRQLVPHLERSMMVVKSTRSKISPQVLLSNELVMDEWTGEPQIHPGLSVSFSSRVGGSSKKIDQEAKKLFNGLLHEEMPSKSSAGGIPVDVILQATEGALGVLLNDA